MKRWFGMIFSLTVLVWALPASALIINGEEIEDLWGYVNEVLDQEQQQWEARQEQAKHNPAFTLERHYDYTALRLLKEEELVRAALQGGYEARRDNQDKPPAVVNLLEEANINRVLEYFPLLVRDTNSSDPLLIVLQGGAGHKAGQQFLLRRAVPGYANRSAFTDYWQDELLRRDDSFTKILTEVIESNNTEDDLRALAMEVLYRHRLRELNDFIRRDPNVREYMASSGNKISPEELVVRDDLSLESWNEDPFQERLSAFVSLAELYGEIVDTKTKAPQSVRVTGRDLLERLYQEVPLSPEDQAAVKTILDEKTL
jgi:hypothetical protein